VGEFTTAIAGDRIRYIPFVSKPSFMDVGLLYRNGETAGNVKKLIASSIAFKEAFRTKSEKKSKPRMDPPSRNLGQRT
jgi:hypothetical protein